MICMGAFRRVESGRGLPQSKTLTRILTTHQSREASWSAARNAGISRIVLTPVFWRYFAVSVQQRNLRSEMDNASVDLQFTKQRPIVRD
jgi:hypothetical protein